MIGTKLAHYEVSKHLGTGGMGEVYQATDSKLGRSVAIKLLPEAFAHDSESAVRFEREARVLASLNHPNIAAIYGIEQSGNRKFLVMELVPGETLAETVERGRVPLEKVFPIAMQIAEGLESAHDKGIVHRDLKPSNIKITPQGQVKLLDFGLAKTFLEEAPDRENSPTIHGGATRSGVILGTIAYMSPEQAQGLPLDARSDIFSFGIVLYELLGGRRPFTGKSSIEVLSAVIRDEPPPLNAPEPVASIVRRCLAKRSSDRFSSVKELKDALQRISVKSAGQEKPSIAVLPFANMSGDKEQEYFSDGLAEEIINALVQVPDLKVIARTSAFAFKGQNTDIRRIAEALGVTSILEGSVRKAGNRIRVTAQLITAADGSHLWSQRYDREMEDVFAVQDEIAAAIAEALKVKLAVRPAKHQPNLPAYEAYLKYRHYQWGFTPESLQRSRECLEQAISLDSQFALPYVGLADFHLASAGVGGMPSHEAMPRARSLAQRALELDPELPEAHGMLGIVAGHHDLDWKEAERRFNLAMAQEPITCHLRQWYALFFLFALGRTEETYRQMLRVLDQDPLSQMWHYTLSCVLAAMQLDNEAVAEGRRAVELDPGFWFGRAFLGLLYAKLGRRTEARECGEKAYAAAPWSPHSIGLLAGTMDAGESKEAEELLATGSDFREPISRAVFHFVRGEIDSAVEWFGKAADQRFVMIMTILIRPFEPVLGQSPGWQGLLKKMRLD
jgi:eukaryotic-like serine/threonine-protein kinase